MCGNLENLVLQLLFLFFFFNVNFISCRQLCSLDCSSLWDLSKREILKEPSGATYPLQQHGDKASAQPPTSQRWESFYLGSHSGTAGGSTEEIRV